MTQTQSIPVLNNGVFLRQTKMDTRFHLDTSDLFSLKAPDGTRPEPLDMGMVSLFANSGFLPERASSLVMNSRRVFLEGHEFKWSHPTSSKEFVLKEDLSFDAEPGRGGAKFKLKFNGFYYDNGWIITPDPQIRSHLLITPDEIIRDGDDYIYTVVVKGVDSQSHGFPKEYLTQGTKFFGLSTVDHEYNKTFSSIPNFEMGKREFMSYVGCDSQQLHYSVTREAAMSPIKNGAMIPYNMYQDVLETYVFRPGTLGFELSLRSPQDKQNINIVDMYKRSYGRNAESRMSRDTVLSSWVPKVEMIAATLLDQMIETNAFYGSGGKVNFDGRTEVPSALGLFHQLMLGNFAPYNINFLTMEYFESIITTYMEGKVEYNPAGVPRVIEIRTGRGGLAAVQNILSKIPAQSGLVWDSQGIIEGIGRNNSALYFNTPQFTMYKMRNGMAILKFIYEPSLDPATASETINPFVTVQNGVGGNRLSSYIYIINDLSGSTTNDNVVEFVYGPDYDVTKVVDVGRLNYPGFGSGNVHRGDITNPGFTVHFLQKTKAYWLVDPTKSLILKPFNPKTGKPIFDY